MKAQIQRRQFLRQAAVAGSSLLLLKSARLAWGYQANEKLNVALVGVGGRGEWFVDAIPRMENVVAACDVNEQKLEAAFKRWADWAGRSNKGNPFERLTAGQVKTFADFREMFDRIGASLDAVIVATPDHTHAVASAAALRAGKPVFCEKPLTRTVHESRALRELARRQKVATSMGNQGTASGGFRRALELIRDGTLGEIKEVHVWNDGGGADRKEPPKGTEPVPNNLKWDLWLGPAAARPYHHEWLQRHLWREFGTNQLGNWASHSANLGFMSLKVHELWLADPPPAKHPLLRVQARTSAINRLSFPRWEVIQWDVPARAGLPPVTFTWHNGPAPDSRDRLETILGEGLDWGDKKAKKWADFAGTLIVGTKGRLQSNAHNTSPRLLPEDQFKGVDETRPQTVEASRGHEADWFQACRGGKPAWANFEYADALNEFLMLGNVATQFDSALEFDPVSMKIVNNAAADALLRCEYRQGWIL
jgi:hypothetical protein